MTDELLPCPFCGSRVLNQFKDDDFHIVQCAQCGCEIRHTQHHKVSVAWNRRVPSAQPARAKALEWRNGVALTPIGNYLVVEEDWDDEPFWFVMLNGKVLNKLGEHKDEASAVSAAQADYERRTLSALTPNEGSK